MRKPVYAICNTKGADQSAHPCSRSLISAFVVLCLAGIIPLLAIVEIVVELADLNLTHSKSRKTGFLMRRLIYMYLKERHGATIVYVLIKR